MIMIQQGRAKVTTMVNDNNGKVVEKIVSYCSRALGIFTDLHHPNLSGGPWKLDGWVFTAPLLVFEDDIDNTSFMTRDFLTPPAMVSWQLHFF